MHEHRYAPDGGDDRIRWSDARQLHVGTLSEVRRKMRRKSEPALTAADFGIEQARHIASVSAYIAKQHPIQEQIYGYRVCSRHLLGDTRPGRVLGARSVSSIAFHRADAERLCTDDDVLLTVIVRPGERVLPAEDATGPIRIEGILEQGMIFEVLDRTDHEIALWAMTRFSTHDAFMKAFSLRRPRFSFSG